ncbi:MAG: acyl-CoA dehydrogenase family protein [Phycisphaerae bacterium]
MALLPPGEQLNEDQRMILDAVGEFARGELLALDRKWDRDKSCVEDSLPKLSEMGLLSLSLPEQCGGLGCSFRLYAAIVHELARCSPSAAVAVCVHNMVCKILNSLAPEGFRHEHLSHMDEPANFAAFCLSEAGAGSDAGGTRAVAMPVDGGYRISGEKMWITNGLAARWFLTLARLEGLDPGENLCAFLIDGRGPGLSREKIRGKMGIRGSGTAVVALDGCFVPDDHLLGARGEGLRVFLTTLNEGRVGIAAQSTGIGEACLDEMVSYARQRCQFGRPIGSFQAIREMVAQSSVDLAVAKALTWRAATFVDSGNVHRAAASMAKLAASEAANRIAYRAVQVHGGAGYVNECRVEQLYRDARVTTIYEGTSEIQRLVIARELAEA